MADAQTLQIAQADCVEFMPGAVIGAIVCDPPYGLEFMGAAWDKIDVPQDHWKPLGPPRGSNNGFRQRDNSADAGHNNVFGRVSSTSPEYKMGISTGDAGFQSPELNTKQSQGMAKWHQGWLKEAYRVLVPGGMIKAFSATRTFHRLAQAMQIVGFQEIHIDAWVYGSGFPKSLNVSKQLDKASGMDAATEVEIQKYLRECREALGISKSVVDQQVFGGTTRYSWVEGRGGDRADETYLPTPEEWTLLKAVLHLDDRFDAYIQTVIPSRKHRLRADGGKATLVIEETGDWGYQQDGDRWDGTRRVTAPATPEAQLFDGYGTALKPAWEPFVVGQKPLFTGDLTYEGGDC